MPTVSSTVQGQSVWLLQAERKIIFVRRPTARGRGIRCAKISTLALDERAPHGFVGYANPRTLRCSVRDRPTVKINKRSENPTVHLLAQREGFEPSCGVIHKLISSQPRYDRFDTSAYKKHIKFYGILIENCLPAFKKSSLKIPKK